MQGAVSFKWMGMEDIDAGSHRAERQVLAYIARGVELARMHRVFGMPTDGGRLPGMKIQNSLLVLPSSHAILCAPQAPLAFS